MTGKNAKKPLTKSEEEKWNEMSNEEKLGDTMGKIPFAVLFTLLEIALVVGGTILALQMAGAVDVIPKEYMDTFESTLGIAAA